MKDKKKMAPGAEEQDMTQAPADEAAMDQEQEEKACKKSLSLTSEDLEKSLGKLSEFASTNSRQTRKAELLNKALESDLEKSEQDELFALMGAQEAHAARSETLLKSSAENEGLQKALDVSEYLREQHQELCKSLGQLADYQEQAEARQHEFNLVLARAISDTGSLVKAMSERLGVIASQPARAPKSRGVNAPLAKSFSGQAPESEQMSKSAVLDILEAMHTESLEKGLGGNASNGENILNAIAKYENVNLLSKSMLEEVQAYRERARAAAH